jgi:hypothetical protein
MRTKIIVRSFEEVLQLLRNAKFDVRELPAVARKGAESPAVRPPMVVSKYGAAAVLASNPAYTPKTAGEQHPVLWVAPPGWVLRGAIARLVDHGNQKLFETPDARVAATADALKSIHRFSEELRDAIGEPSLYNQSLGTVSDLYVYDRVKGREHGSEDISDH